MIDIMFAVVAIVVLFAFCVIAKACANLVRNFSYKLNGGK